MVISKLGDVQSVNHGGGTLAGSNITAITVGSGPIYKTTFTLAAHALTVTDSGANGGHGTVEFFTFPEGQIKIIGSTASVSIFSAQGSAQADSGVYDLGVGSAAVATDNEELSLLEQNVLTKMEGTLDGSGDLAATETQINSTDLILDGSSTAITLNFNAAITAATISATEIFDTTAVFNVTWMLLGDY